MLVQQNLRYDVLLCVAAEVVWRRHGCVSYRFRGVSGGLVGECAGSLHASLFIIPVGNFPGRSFQVEVIQGAAETLEVILSFKCSPA